MNARNIMSVVGEFARNGLGVPVLVMAVIAMMVLPLPAFLLDIFFTFNISLSLVILLAVIYVRRALEFATFPTVLLGATLLRLGLNVASTRIVLINGHTGAHAAGHVIAAFGQFVVGGNYAVGMVVFVVLVIINFVVITKGAGRISEVSARFTLDAMPGRQMAIDADLNAGIITQAEAIVRRQEVREEADFYGAMDGASKFVRGDAVAGILIVFINLFGGTIIGAAQHGIVARGRGPHLRAAHHRRRTGGADSGAAAVRRGRHSGNSRLAIARHEPANHVAGAGPAAGARRHRRHLGAARHHPRHAQSGVLGDGRRLRLRCLLPWQAARHGEKGRGGQAGDAHRRLRWSSASFPGTTSKQVDLIGLEVGYRLIPLVDRNQGGELMGRIKGVRKKLSEELGFLVQAVHIRDNLELGPNSYRITILGAPVGESEVFPDRELAINPGQVSGTLPGTATKDPAFGLAAVWIEKSRRDQAQAQGFTVVDASSVIATHLSHLLQSHAHELLGHEEVQQLLNRLAKSAPKLIEDLVPKLLPMSVVVKVLQQLLQERVPIRNLRTVCETLAEACAQDPGSAGAGGGGARRARPQHRAEHQRTAGRAAGHDAWTRPGTGVAGFLDERRADSTPGFEPGLADRIQQGLADSTRRQEAAGEPAVLLVAPKIRPWVARLMRYSTPSLSVLAYNEIPENRRIRVIAAVGR